MLSCPTSEPLGKKWVASSTAVVGTWCVRSACCSGSAHHHAAVVDAAARTEHPRRRQARAPGERRVVRDGVPRQGVHEHVVAEVRLGNEHAPRGGRVVAQHEARAVRRLEPEPVAGARQEERDGRVRHGRPVGRRVHRRDVARLKLLAAPEAALLGPHAVVLPAVVDGDVPLAETEEVLVRRQQEGLAHRVQPGQRRVVLDAGGRLGLRVARRDGRVDHHLGVVEGDRHVEDGAWIGGIDDVERRARGSRDRARHARGVQPRVVLAHRVVPSLDDERRLDGLHAMGRTEGPVRVRRIARDRERRVERRQHRLAGGRVLHLQPEVARVHYDDRVRRRERHRRITEGAELVAAAQSRHRHHQGDERRPHHRFCHSLRCTTGSCRARSRSKSRLPTCSEIGACTHL